MAKKAVDESLQAFRHLASPDPLERVYLFYGEDNFVLDKLVNAIEKKRFKGKAIDPLSWESYRAGEVDVIKPIDAVRTISMFGGAKVVIFRDVDKLNENDLQKIVDYVQKPARAHLVLLATKIDARKKSWTEIKKHAYSVNCTLLDERNVSEYVKSAAAEKKLPFDALAADALANCIGPNRALIERALEKLQLALPPDQLITPEMIEEHVIDTRERSIFELTKAITKRNIPAALDALRALLYQKQEPVVINGMLARHARMVIQVKLGKQQRLSDNEIAQKAGINPYALREYLEAANNYSLTELYQFHADIFETDRSLKSKPVPAHLALSKLLLSLLKA